MRTTYPVRLALRPIVGVIFILSCFTQGFLRTSESSSTRASSPACVLGMRNHAPFCPSLLVRGGNSEEDGRSEATEPDGDEKVQYDSQRNEKSPKSTLHEESSIGSEESEAPPSVEVPVTNERQHKTRHSSDVISKILAETGPTEESYDLRKMISSRAQAYMDDLLLCTSDERLPHPTRFLHYVAPKVPAIKHSPDFMLRVQCSRSDMDPGVAACIIGSAARVCESYEKHSALTGRGGKEKDTFSAGSDIARDRRFEQLVECVLCGVDVRRRREEAQQRQENGKDGTEEESRDIEEVLDEEDAKFDAGLSIQDACRAAWGIAILGGYDLETIGGESTSDILSALSLRTRERLLARLQLLRQGEPRRQIDDDGSMSLAEKLELDAQSLAQDAASAIWSFACVKACTGVRSVLLIEDCCSILCQNPAELRDKASAESEGLEGPSFAVNDVVERLARSEVDADSIADANVDGVVSERSPDVSPDDFAGVSRDSLLDWLSPNEVTDVLWALALHGSPTEPESKEKLTLSETTSAFREIAFDRLVGWLRRDFEMMRIQVSSESPDDLVHISEGTKCTDQESEAGTDLVPTTRAQEDMVVEVVDAATLLKASEAAHTAFSLDIESVSTDGVRCDSDIASLQVVDAATLLAAESTGSAGEIETELIVTPVPIGPSMETKESNHGDVALEELKELRVNESPSDRSPMPNTSDLLRSNKLSFSPHDLCSIAWAVTDLRDPLRFLIVDLVSQMFNISGRQSLTHVSGGDLANLAWAISRSATRELAVEWEQSDGSPTATVTRWIAETVLERLDLTNEETRGPEMSCECLDVLLNEFQPPELGRLMWSLAFTIDNIVDPFERQDNRVPSMSRLAEVALCTAGSNIAVFGTEDLVRISWSFLQLCESVKSLSDPDVAESLGRILAVIETSLLLWETSQALGATVHDTEKPDDSVRYSTFFGKSRFSLPILNQRIGEYEVDDGDVQPYPLNGRRSLPLLRDLSVDPSSLCKLAAGYAELGRVHRDVKGGWTLIRVAIRLLASKNGQLMKQCSTRDIIRLCHACSTNEIHGHGREHVTRLFTRRVLQLMNAAFDIDSEDHIGASGRFSRASPWDKAMLIWCFGELGVRHVSHDDFPRMAHRKLQLVSDRDLLSSEELAALSAESVSRLLHGAVSMNMLASKPSFVRSVLKTAETRVLWLQRGADLCELNYSASKLVNAIGTEDPAISSFVVGAAETSAETNTPKDRVGSQKVATESLVLGDPPVESEILSSCYRLLSAIAKRCLELTDQLSANEMQKLLIIYASSPFQAEDVVDAIEAEAKKRLGALTKFALSESSVDESTRIAAESIQQAGDGLFGKSGDSPVASIRNGIISLFRPSDNNNAASGDAEEIAAHMQQATSYSEYTADRLRQLREGTGLEAEAILRGKQHGTAIELGRCLELVASYRRVDFATGTRQSRYNRAGRQSIGKRVLSRLFPLA